jgi:hypothetical protein
MTQALYAHMNNKTIKKEVKSKTKDQAQVLSLPITGIEISKEGKKKNMIQPCCQGRV